MKNRIAFLTIAAAILAGSARTVAQLGTRDYSQWRGNNRDGSASAFEEPKTWPDRLTRRWKVEVGEGYATPLVIGNTVYTFTRRGGDEVVAALDAASGVERWHTQYSAPYTASQPAAAHGAGAKATPLFHEGKLFTLGISGIVSAFDAASGTLLWQTSAPAEPPFFSAASSPAGAAGIVIVHPGNYGPLTAFDVSTGAIKWTAGSGGFFASPIIVTLDGIRQVISSTQDSVVGVSVPDGAVLWKYPLEAPGGATTPVVWNDTIIVSAMRVGTFAFKPVRRDGRWTADPVWENRNISMYVSNAVVIGDAVFGLAEQGMGQFFALDAKSGRTLWLGPPREAANTAIVKAGDLLFLLKDDAELIVARASRTRFDPVKRYTVADSATWAQPAISGNRIFIKDVSTLTLWTID